MKSPVDEGASEQVNDDTPLPLKEEKVPSPVERAGGEVLTVNK